MYIEKTAKKDLKNTQVSTPSLQRAQNTQRLIKLQKNSEEIGRWINQQIKIQRQNERSLQQKIIQLYQQIEKKAIKNIERKKNNQILQAQISAYISIINKIEKKTKINIEEQEHKQQNTYNYTFHQQAQIPEYSHQNQRRNNLEIDSDHMCRNQSMINRSDINQNNLQMAQFYGSFINGDTQDNYTNYKNKKAYNQKPIKTQATEYNNSITNINRFSSDNPHSTNNSYPNIKYQKQNKFSRFQSYKNSQSHPSEISISPFNFQTPTHVKTHRASNSNFKSPVSTYRTNNQQYQRQIIYVSPRPSITRGVGMRKLCSPNKSFLNKNNMSTGNLHSKYASIDIQDLWNDSNTLICKKDQNKIIPKATTKQYFNSLRESQTNFKVKTKFN